MLLGTSAQQPRGPLDLLRTFLLPWRRHRSWRIVVLLQLGRREECGDFVCSLLVKLLDLLLPLVLSQRAVIQDRDQLLAFCDEQWTELRLLSR